MKKILTALAALSVLCACTSKENPDTDQSGALSLKLSSSGDYITKAGQDDTDEFKIELTRTDGWSLTYDRFADMPEILDLAEGNYTISAISPESKHAAFDLPIYGATGLTDFLKENEKKLFVLGCNLPNWLFRFLWQPTQVGRINNLKTTQGYWINKEKPEDSFENFLKKKNFSADEQVKEILVDATKLLQEEQQKEAEERSLQIDAEEHFDVVVSYASEDRQIATAKNKTTTRNN